MTTPSPKSTGCSPVWALALPLFLGLLALVYVLPKSSQVDDTSLNMELPVREELTGWWGEKRMESPEERSVLSPDTEFSKADYFKVEGLIMKKLSPLPVHVSLVRSGNDMNASIHRPERCLPSQGHYDMQGGDETWEVALPNGEKKEVSLRRLTTKQVLKTQEGEEKVISSLHYYTFVGNRDITSGHYERVFCDIRDRVLFGREQRWAYVQVSTLFGEGTPYSEEEARALIFEVLHTILKKNVYWDQLEGSSKASQPTKEGEEG